jgi:hypothetical protein
MNPARSLAPPLLSGVLGNLWVYWFATWNINCCIYRMDTELVFQKYYSRMSTPISIKNPSRSNPSADFDSI